MSKHNPRPDKSLVQELLLKSRDELHDMRMDLHKRIEVVRKFLSKLNSRSDSIRAAMRIKEQGCEIGVLDHAVLRYLERHKGVDVPAARRELSQSIADRIRVDARKANGGTAIMDRYSNVVATYISDEMAVPNQDGYAAIRALPPQQQEGE